MIPRQRLGPRRQLRQRERHAGLRPHDLELGSLPVDDGTNAEVSARRVAVKPRSGAPKAHGLAAISLAEAQFVVPSGATLPLSLHATQSHPELPTVSAEMPILELTRG
jgi:hypothetical protein